jgi:hypothetical protein
VKFRLSNITTSFFHQLNLARKQALVSICMCLNPRKSRFWLYFFNSTTFCWKFLFYCSYKINDVVQAIIFFLHELVLDSFVRLHVDLFSWPLKWKQMIDLKWICFFSICYNEIVAEQIRLFLLVSLKNANAWDKIFYVHTKFNFLSWTIHY